MTEEQFLSFAQKNNVSSKYYSLNGEFVGDDVFYVRENYGKWEVYYFERGLINNMRTFNSKSEAIENLYQRIKKALDLGFRYK